MQDSLQTVPCERIADPLASAGKSAAGSGARKPEEMRLRLGRREAEVIELCLLEW